MQKDTSLTPLYARLDDIAARAQKGEMSQSDFLSPRELFFAESYLGRLSARFFSFGGYADAERRRVYILPDYMEGAENAEDIAAYGFDLGISAVCVKPSGYRALTHRDYLGSVLGLGLERSVIGDILISEQGDAVVFCETKLCAFLCSELSRIANDKVKVSEIPLTEVNAPPRRYADINDTVASARLDCVVGALCSLSRDKARAAVEAGLVELDYVNEQRADKEVREGALVSVRGYGKFKISALSDKTKKGRFRLTAQKFL